MGPRAAARGRLIRVLGALYLLIGIGVIAAAVVVARNPSPDVVGAATLGIVVLGLVLGLLTGLGGVFWILGRYQAGVLALWLPASLVGLIGAGNAAYGVRRRRATGPAAVVAAQCQLKATRSSQKSRNSASPRTFVGGRPGVSAARLR
ncbi:hypothetical protein [Phaeacidiphilus oryzae]|uniref:hypothetical protein n=1 Tax=Phaeacidiphilus oryzae TaxID=348818 RepID=UPI00055F7718|nr:hypothetical protein [Phaeacidiphilus oryzae]